MPTLADNIRAERNRRDMTQAELAKAAGIGVTSVVRLEGGIGKPSLETVQNVATALGLPMDALIVSEPTHASQQEQAR